MEVQSEAKLDAPQQQQQETAETRRGLPVTFHSDVRDVDGEVEGADGLTLDLSNVPNGGIARGYELAATLTDVDLTHNQIQAIEGLGHLRALRKLVLRQNVIHEIAGLESLVSLTHLDLYDNKIGEIKNLEGLAPTLTYLDLSYNLIRRVQNIESLVHLKELYLVENKIEKVEGLETLTALETLELGANRVRAVPEKALANHTKLGNLWLGRNKLTRITGLEGLSSLRLLSAQANRLTEIDVAALQPVRVSLQEVYLSDNAIASLTFAVALESLHILDIANNRVAKLVGLSALKALEELWANGNKIENWEELQELRPIASLRVVYFEGNPIAGHQQYRRLVQDAIPQLTQIDATPVYKS